jgi:UDP-N-acetylmuramoyl-L-alanyl-D-glutamate--2,6-diaminopimelate ligase
MDSLLQTAKRFIPKKVFGATAPIYHYALAFLGAVMYRFPSKELHIVTITGTKGKTSTTEMVNAILEAAGHTTAVAGTLRFKIGKESRPNLFKMTVQGRFFLQKFLRDAVNAGCTHAVLEMTSQAVIQSRHKFIAYDSFIFLNISPEHIESHGNFENYLKAKLEIAKAVANSSKKRKILISNIDDPHGQEFLEFPHAEKHSYTLKDVSVLSETENGVRFTYKDVEFESVMPGTFSIYNMLAAITYAETQNIPLPIAANGLKNLSLIRGRVEKVRLPAKNPKSAKQNFTVIVDYAHTADSLEKLYTAFKDSPKICLLGNTGGGRDTWKRPEMAKVADRFAKHIILTNEDPYDEDPGKITDEMVAGISKTPHEVIIDRREAINKALKLAQAGDVVMITGKGTDPYIMEAGGKKTKWDDATVVREELEKILV